MLQAAAAGATGVSGDGVGVGGRQHGGLCGASSCPGVHVGLRRPRGAFGIRAPPAHLRVAPRRSHTLPEPVTHRPRRAGDPHSAHGPGQRWAQTGNVGTPHPSPSGKQGRADRGPSVLTRALAAPPPHTAEHHNSRALRDPGLWVNRGSRATRDHPGPPSLSCGPFRISPRCPMGSRPRESRPGPPCPRPR